MINRIVVAVVVVCACLAVGAGQAHAATCAVACRDEVAACIGTDCQGLTKRALRHCKRQCKHSLVRDCFADLTVCGATEPRAPKPGGGGSGGGSSGGGSSGGW